ncbi:MAG: S8 family serine peptidase [Muribaculaceae bacterium]|nr:S8 family serine peptidase [Muribaculaceae bacterium]
MKKFITFIVAIFGMSLSISAQDSFYYYQGKEVPLSEDATRIVLIAPKTEDISLSSSRGVTLVKTISDTSSLIKVYEVSSSSTIKHAIAEYLYASVTIMPCYKSISGNELIPNGYINVKLKSAADYSTLQTVAQQKGCEIIEQNPFMPLWYNLRVKYVPGHNSVDIANAIYETGKFAAAFPSFTFDAIEISYDPNVYEQWGLYNSQYEGIDISISQAWSYATGRGIKVAVVDEGIDLNHQDLRDNIYPLSYDTDTKTSPSKLYGSHGTHCAGIVAAVRNNGIQVAGVAPDAKLMSVSNSFSSATNIEANLANGINWAWQNGADVISCSWGCGENELVGEAIDNAVTKGREGKGCVFVNSAGNTGKDITFPGDYSPDVIAVSNMTKDGSIEIDSSYGPNLLVTAPGTYILSTTQNNQIAKMSGTSMACAHVSGLAALILERNPSLTAKKVREIIAKNTKKIGNIPYNTNKIYGTWNEKYGYGLIDAYNAVINTPRN